MKARTSLICSWCLSGMGTFSASLAFDAGTSRELAAGCELLFTCSTCGATFEVPLRDPADVELVADGRCLPARRGGL